MERYVLNGTALLGGSSKVTGAISCRQSKNRLFHDAEYVSLRNINRVSSFSNAPDLTPARSATPVGSLSNPVSLSQRPRSKRSFVRWLRPLLLLSVGLHSLLLLSPVPDIKKSEEVLEEEEPEVIEVVTLPQAAPLPAAADIEAPLAVAPPPEPVTPEPIQPPPAAEPIPAVQPQVQDIPPTAPESQPDPRPEPEPQTLAQQLADPSQYGNYAKADTEDPFYDKESLNWYSEIGMIPSEYTLDPPLVVEAPLCPTPLPASIVKVGVVINLDGSLNGEPRILQSTGYEILNEQAKQLLVDHTYPIADAVSAYFVELPVSTNCVE